MVIVQQVWIWLFDMLFYQYVYIMLIEIVLGYIIGIGLGVVGGVWFGLSCCLVCIFDFFIKGFNVILCVVLVLIFVLWLGLGLWLKVVLVVILVFFIMFFNVMQGVCEVNLVVLVNVCILGVSCSDLLCYVYFLVVVSWILFLLCILVGFVVVGVIIGEYFGVLVGLGYLIVQVEGNFNVVGVFVGIIILVVFVLVIDVLLDVVENKLIIWCFNVQVQVIS